MSIEIKFRANKGELNMKTIEELRNYLLENYVDECGNLDISYLDFSDFDGDVHINNMKVKGYLSQSRHDVQGSLSQSRHDVQGSLEQGGHDVQGSLSQSGHDVQGNLEQSRHDVQGSLEQGGHDVQGSLEQSYHEVRGNLYNQNNKYGGSLCEKPSIKILKEVTAEELAELGYKLKGE